MFEKHWPKKNKKQTHKTRSPSQGAPTLPSLLNFSFLPSGSSFTHHKITLTWKTTPSITPPVFSQINSSQILISAHFQSIISFAHLQMSSDWQMVWNFPEYGSFFFQFIQDVKCKFPCFPLPLFSLRLVYTFSSQWLPSPPAGMNTESHRDLWRELCLCACAEWADQRIHAPQINEPVPVQCVWQKGRIIPRCPLRWDESTPLLAVTTAAKLWLGKEAHGRRRRGCQMTRMCWTENSKW